MPYIFAAQAPMAGAAQQPVKAAFIQPTDQETTSGGAAQPFQSAPPKLDLERFGTITTATLPKAPNGEPFVARVNGQPLTWSAYKQECRLLSPDLFEANPTRQENIYAALAGPALDAMILQELYRQYAADHKLTIQPSEVQRRRNQFVSHAASRLAPVLRTMAPADVDDLVSMSLTREKVNQYLQDVATSAPATTEEIARLTANAVITTSPETITRARHIVIRATPDMSEFNVNDAKALAEEVLMRIKLGLPFEKAAQQYSQDRFSAWRGGDIGYFKPGAMYPEFENAAAALQPGEISGIVRTPVGFHIIQITERHPDDFLLKIDQLRGQRAIEDWKRNYGDQAQIERFIGN